MATRDAQPLQKIQKPMLRQLSADENVHELLLLLRNQEESPDETLLNETKCLLSLSLDKTTMPPLPSIKSKKEQSRSDKRGNEHKSKIQKQKESVETNASSDDEVSDATQSPTFTPSANVKRHLPSLGSRDEGCTTSSSARSKTSSQARKT